MYVKAIARQSSGSDFFETV